MTSSKIPIEARQHMLSALVALGERLFDHSQRLQEASFTAWTVFYDDSTVGCRSTDLTSTGPFSLKQPRKRWEMATFLHRALQGLDTSQSF
jgi:hypothetical protein